MKNNASLLLVLLCLFVCCKKPDGPDKPPDPGHEKKYPVTFQLSGFEQSFTDLKTAEDTISKYIDQLFYIVFRATSKEFVKIINQNTIAPTAPRFGVITDSLPAGQYIIALIGSVGEVNLGTDDGSSPPFRILWAVLPGNDIFYKRIELTVNGSVNQIVSLDRVVAKLKLVVRDRIPFDAKQIEIHPNMTDPQNPQQTVGTPNALDLADGVILPSGPLPFYQYGSHLHEFTADEKGMENFTIESYQLVKGPGTINTATINVDIKVTDNQSRVLGAKTVQGVKLFAGKGTVLSGKLFDGLNTSDSGLNVILNDPEWVNDSIQVNF